MLRNGAVAGEFSDTAALIKRARGKIVESNRTLKARFVNQFLLKPAGVFRRYAESCFVLESEIVR